MRATVKNRKSAPVRAKRKGAAPKQHPIVEIARRLSSQIPEKEWRRCPADLAEQHDHYIYGTPKR